MKNNYTLKKTLKLLVVSFCFFFSSFSSIGQTLNFTSDTAIDNGSSITETITMGPDDFVLTISHPGNEDLFDLGAGDFVIFISSLGVTINESYNISLTKNGDPFSFTLNSLDYDTVEAGDISIENQDDAIITPNTNYGIGIGTISPTNMANATDISSFKITPNDTDSSFELNDFAFHNFNITVGSILNTTAFEINKLKLYPNPSNGNVTIKNSGLALQNATITDINGRTIGIYDLKGVREDKHLDLSSVLSSGIYLIKISSSTSTTVKKLLVQ
ncbi:T9SS type A sorting domain-containing protein [uncultured Winogradskyella sp.]|uniref:T9SS type A sorting domain-containing protein n=1 Tax=uncultured Winogradskyella sp. TaxID=395353 RepID=UPI00262E68EE|nr:T9SS type A sorting domain-containing protein [uncultured Winogradskyella sp.]